MKRLFAVALLLLVLFPLVSVSAQETSITGTPCAAAASPEWDELMDDTDALLKRSQVEFASGSLAFSPANTETLRDIALDWIDLNERWREIEIPAGREIIQFTANRLAGHMSSTFTSMIDGSIDEFQLGKTSEAMDAYIVSYAVFDLWQIGC